MQCDRDQCRHNDPECDLNCKRDNERAVDCIKSKVNYFQINPNLMKKNETTNKTP